MVRILGISGSLRRGSFNTALLRAASGLMPQDEELVVESISEIPLYNADVEAQGIPARVVALKQIVREADGCLLSTPEYNNSIPGVLKNTVDWLSRPATDIKDVFGGKPVAIMSYSHYVVCLSIDEHLAMKREDCTTPL